MIGLIGAMEVEISRLKEQMRGVREVRAGGCAFYTGEIYGVPAALARCGIGKVHAAMCAQSLLISVQPEFVLNIGVAGALREEIGIGDIVVASCAVQHDVDTTAFGDPKGMISGINRVALPCDETAQKALADAAARCGLTVFSGAIATGDRFVEALDEKRALARDFSAAGPNVPSIFRGTPTMTFAIPRWATSPAR